MGFAQFDESNPQTIECSIGNSSGTSRETRTLKYYEQLPRSARAALANARFNWATRSLLSKFERGALNAKQLVAYIQKTTPKRRQRNGSKSGDGIIR
jgi:hypothetical protein